MTNHELRRQINILRIKLDKLYNESLLTAEPLVASMEDETSYEWALVKAMRDLYKS